MFTREADFGNFERNENFSVINDALARHEMFPAKSRPGGVPISGDR
jgi:hypothetical protein